MEGKLKKEELLKVIGQMEAIEKLPKQLLEELCRVFKVEELNAPQHHLIQQFKSKVVDIFMQEADGYMDYLQLPKFRTLGPDSTEKMHTLFSSIWKEYGAYLTRQQASLAKKQIEELTPSFDSSEKMEQFHLHLLQLYRDSAICPKNSRSNSKNFPEIKAKPPQPEINNFLFPNPPMNGGGIANGSVQNPIFPHYPFSQTPSYPKVEAQEGNPYIIENKIPLPMPSNPIPQPMFDLPRYNMQPHAHPSFFPPPEIYPSMRMREQRIEQPPVIKNLFSQSLQGSTSLFLNYEFIQCVCEGKKGEEDKNNFKCAFCNYSYHLSCMKIENNPAGGSVCPLCILRRETVFCKVNHEPLKFNWHLSEKGKELKVEMTEHESHLIYEARKNGLDCQIRFLKINGKSVKKDRRLMDFTSCNGYLLKATRHTEITLPELSQDRHQPISLEIVLRSEEDNSEQNIPKLYLFAVFLITIKKIDNIVEEAFASNTFVTFDYYNQLFGAQGRILVNLQSEIFGRGQIKYPVRGQLCKHAQVFDLKNFLEVVSDLKKDNNTEINCPICSVACTYFIYDKFIYTAIQNFPEYEQKKPQAISIERSGEYYWVGDDGNNNQSEPMHPQEENMEEERDGLNI